MRVKLSFLMLLPLCFALSSCDSSLNSDASEEIPCSAATGTWFEIQTTCSGSVQSATPFHLVVISASGYTANIGSAACRTSFNFNVTHTTPAVSLAGTGSAQCLSNGASVPSCANAEHSCSSSFDPATFTQNFSSCAISGGQMRLSRTVSQADIDSGASDCALNDVEQVILSQTAPATQSLVVASSSVADFGSVALGSSASGTVTVENIGTGNVSGIGASGLALPFSFVGGYPGTGGTCGASLAGGASCTMVVQFEPTAAGAATDTLILTYSDGTSIRTLNHNLGGTGTSGSTALLIFSPASALPFGNQPVGSPVTQLWQVVNTGGGPATSIFGSTIPSTEFSWAGGSYPGVGGTCGSTLAAAATCSIAVQFNPSSPGPKASALTLDYNDGLNFQNIQLLLSGNGQ